MDEPEASELTKQYEEGKKSLHSHDYKKASKRFTKAIKSFDSTKDDINDLAIIFCARSAAHYHAGNLELSLQDAEEAIRSRPNWSKVLF